MLYLTAVGMLTAGVFKLPRAEKMLWLSMFAGLAPHIVTASMEYGKSVWFVFAMIMVQNKLLGRKKSVPPLGGRPRREVFRPKAV